MRSARPASVALAVALAASGCAEVGALLPRAEFTGVVPDGLSCLAVPREICTTLGTSVGWREGNPLLAGVAVVCTRDLDACDEREGAAALHLRLTDGTAVESSAEWELDQAGQVTISQSSGVSRPPDG